MIVRIYTGHDGQTHFEDLPLPAEENHNVALQAGANLVFRCFPADYWSDWHTAPRRQYIFGSSAETVGNSGCVGWQRLTGRHGQLWLGHADHRQVLRLRRTAARLRDLTATRMAKRSALVPSMTRSVRRGSRASRIATAVASAVR